MTYEATIHWLKLLVHSVQYCQLWRAVVPQGLRSRSLSQVNLLEILPRKILSPNLRPQTCKISMSPSQRLSTLLSWAERVHGWHATSSMLGFPWVSQEKKILTFLWGTSSIPMEGSNAIWMIGPSSGEGHKRRAKFKHYLFFTSTPKSALCISNSLICAVDSKIRRGHDRRLI